MVSWYFNESSMLSFADYLDAPVLRVTGVDVPMPYAATLEAAALPSVEDVVTTVKKSLNIA